MQIPDARCKFPARLGQLFGISLLVLLFPMALVAQRGKPLTSKEVLQLLQGGVPSPRIAALVEEKNIDFELAPPLEIELRAAGASNELMIALRLASKLRSEQKAQQTAALTVVSQPGEAEVYLDDQPRGTTSGEGKLVLSGLAPGARRLRVYRKGFESWERTITVAAGESPTVRVALTARPAEAPAPPLAPGRSEVGPETGPTAARSASPGSGADVLRAAKTLCISLGAGSNPVLKTEIAEKLLKWGRLTLVASPAEADLILNVQQTGRALLKTSSGNQAAAILKTRASNLELWSTTKGGGWSMRGYSMAWVARAIAGDFVKFFDASTHYRR